MRGLTGNERGIHPIWGILVLVVIVVYLVLLVLFPALILAVTLLLIGVAMLAGGLLYHGLSPQERTTIVVFGIILIAAGALLGYLGSLDALSLSLTGGL